MLSEFFLFTFFSGRNVSVFMYMNITANNIFFIVLNSNGVEVTLLSNYWKYHRYKDYTVAEWKALINMSWDGFVTCERKRS